MFNSLENKGAKIKAKYLRTMMKKTTSVILMILMILKTEVVEKRNWMFMKKKELRIHS